MKFSDFGFKENPFSITPDPRYLFLSRGHEESLAHLIYGVGPNGGFVQLTGEVGTGKTMLVRSLLEQHLENVEFALIFNPKLSRRAFLAAICDELGISYTGPPYSLKQLIDNLTRHLLEAHTAGRNTVLVVDEAQNLSPRVLETVRMLTNLETARHKLLRIILVGQPELQQMLEQRELRQVAQRITARFHLSPLSRKETSDYIRHRLEVAGVSEHLFTTAGMWLTYSLSGGVPRIINTICERALLAIFATDARRAGVRLVWRAAKEIRGRKRRGRWSKVWMLGLLLGVVGGASWWLAPLIGPLKLESQQLHVVPELPVSVETTESGEQPQHKAGQLDSRAEGDGSEASLSEHISQTDDGEWAAHARLFALWGFSLTDDLALLPCEYAKELGLRCLTDVAGWEDLERLNRPALLYLNVAGEKRYLLLKALHGEQAIVDYGAGERAVLRSEIAPLWRGEFTMLWRPHAGEALIGPGSDGPLVTWLRRRLAMSNGIKLSADGVSQQFDEKLGVQLREYQLRTGLKPDGVAGQKTQIQLNNLQLMVGTPTLTGVSLVEGE
ncbi:AAA family ATPase [endosymbiont of Ridgeia piscesae]|jgi:general secretion pathway protein A|uniref:Type II secretion system protein A n=1 Tax=endosymbiont of Ridgeia piscesae TaxID=54398 RepID=A0A0T5YWS0_9GAMM|nr:AAA family ATPase [endosymbiont of Ridgeia piscesae]KRT55058.1 Type II secretory pathway, component ExeA (predicted ATPase) [endosymbiont of Ridgeia piscesae]KRT60212.1 type II secretion system protein A [endosymbiont of Ridgeia piscesae]